MRPRLSFLQSFPPGESPGGFFPQYHKRGKAFNHPRGRYGLPQSVVPVGTTAGPLVNEGGVALSFTAAETLCRRFAIMLQYLLSETES